MRYVLLRCDNCHITSGHLPAPENDIALQGWVVDKGRDLCPDCWWEMSPVPVAAQRKQA